MTDTLSSHNKSLLVGLVLICLIFKGDGWVGIERCLRYESDEFDDLWLKSVNADI